MLVIVFTKATICWALSARHRRNQELEVWAPATHIQGALSKFLLGLYLLIFARRDPSQLWNS